MCFMCTHIFLKTELKNSVLKNVPIGVTGLQLSNNKFINGKLGAGVHLTWRGYKRDCHGTKNTLHCTIACTSSTCACLLSNHMMENEIFHFIEADLSANKVLSLS